MLPSKEQVEKAPAKIVNTKIIGIGEEIYLADDLWNTAVGLYPCRSIQIPDFTVAGMEEAGQKKGQEIGRNRVRNEVSLLVPMTIDNA